MTFMFLRSSAALALLLGIASCASAPPPHANGAAGREYFPLLPGAHWVYELHTGPFSHTTLDVTARGERPVRGSETGIFVVEERTAGELFGLDPSGLVGYRVADGYMTRVPALELGADGVVRMFGRDGVMVLPVDPQPGQRWTDQVAVFDNTPGESAQSWTARIENVGRLHVPAGGLHHRIVGGREPYGRAGRADQAPHTHAG